MTTESQEDEDKKRTTKIIKQVQKYKLRLGILLSAALVSTVWYVPPAYTTIPVDDPTFQKPYHPDTISVKLLLSASLPLPFLIMTVLEWIYPASCKGNVSPFWQGLCRSWRYISDLYVGGILMFFINDLLKIATHEARPSFWSICMPNVTDEQRQQSTVKIYLENCTNPMNFSQRSLADSMKSFPSGHASVSVYTTILVMVYIKERVWRRNKWQLVACLQLVCVYWAFICCLSRIWDNKHHWWDVLAGVVLGACGSVITLKYFSNWFIREESQEKTPILNDQDDAPVQDEAT